MQDGSDNPPFPSRKFAGKVHSNQSGVHKDLSSTVKKHLNSFFAKPIAAHTQSAFEEIKEQIKLSNKPLIFDSGCGTGDSSITISKLHPGHLIIGIDRSEKRLEKGRKRLSTEKSASVLLVRAELADFWRLALSSNLLPDYHYILFPNPYPKKEHLKRRWHAHPVFRSLIALGGSIELRSDWKLYLEEFQLACELAGCSSEKIEGLNNSVPALSPFEAKYISQNRSRFRLQITIKSSKSEQV